MDAAHRTVLVGTDGSVSSFTAVERAARLSADTGAELVIVCAYQPLSGPELDRARDELGTEAYQVVGSAPAEESLRVARVRAFVQGAVKVQLQAVQGKPVPVLLQVAGACSADLLVVGNRRLRSLAGRLLGSAPADVARKAGMDVLIVHTT
ncbi:universal stress protein [Streptomyces californicus]|uniref:universal stress protein n=1 Tax=Streptomyces californicus TaxID=67351 RepID=UPI00371D2E94